MPLDASQVSEIKGMLLETFGLVAFHRIGGELSQAQLPDRFTFPELDADPDNPDSGCVLYCIDDNGSGKVELRARFPTGVPQAVATEP